MPKFDGDTYVPERDGERLTGQLERVWEYMSDSKWRTLGDIVSACGGTEASVSARLRDFRKEKFGKHIVKRRYIGSGVWEYRLIALGPLKVSDDG